MPHNTLQSKLNAECSMMKFDKYNLGKRISNFLSKFCWQFNQTVPNYSTVNYRRSGLANKRSLNSRHHQQQSVNNQNLYTKQYRKHSLRERTTTLTSIQEENEIELMNIK